MGGWSQFEALCFWPSMRLCRGFFVLLVVRDYDGFDGEDAPGGFFIVELKALSVVTW